MDFHDDGLERHVGASQRFALVVTENPWRPIVSRRMGFCLTPATQGSTRRICTEGRECTNHNTRNRTSMICELQMPDEFITFVPL